MANETKSAAELAREERKARIEKASESQTKKNEKKANQTKGQKRAKWLIPTIAVVIALVIAFLFYFGVPQRTNSAIKFNGSSATGDGASIENVSVAELEYYYKLIYNNVVNTAYEYETYYSAYYGEGAGLMMTGFDYTKSPKNQECTLTEADTGIALDPEKYGENPTWADFIAEYSIRQAQEINAVYAAALKAGVTLTDEEKATIDEQIESIRSSAAASNYSLNAYLMQTYGRGMNEKLLREIMTKQSVASSYITAKEEEITNAVTDEDIQNAYAENPNEYDLANLCYFTFEAEQAVNVEAQEATETTEAVEGTNYTEEELAEMTAANIAEQKELAEAFYEEVTLDNFASVAAKYADDEMKDYYDPSSELYNDAYVNTGATNQSSISSYFGEDVANWAYDSSTNIGDKFMGTEEADDGCTIFTIVVLNDRPEKDETLQPVSVRHILFALTEDVETTDEDGNATTETKDIRTMDEALALAQETLDSWVEGGAKEDDFSSLAAEKSEDPGSADNGGLIEGITTTSSYVEPFLNWCFEDGRKVGDYGIVETEYGAHIMYMSYISDKPQWQQDIATSLATDRCNEFYSAIVDDEAYALTVSDKALAKIQNRIEDYAAKVIASFEQEANTAAADTSADTSAE